MADSIGRRTVLQTVAQKLKQFDSCTEQLLSLLPFIHLLTQLQHREYGWLVMVKFLLTVNFLNINN